MDTNALKKFAQAARNLLIGQVTAKLAVVIDPASSARRENPAAMKSLDAAIKQTGKAQVIEQVAYTWFNCPRARPPPSPRFSMAAAQAATRRARPTVLCSSMPATPGTSPCPSCSRRWATTPNC